MAGYAFEGYCYPSIDSIVSTIDSRLTIAGALVNHPVYASSDSVGSFIGIPLRVISGTSYADLPPLIYRPVSCENLGPLSHIPFDPASLDTAIISQAFSAGFLAVSLPVVFAIGVSTVLDFIRGKSHA